MTKNAFVKKFLAVAALSAFSFAAGANTVVCESTSHQTQHCRADTSRGVRLATQYSGAGCYQGSTWGYDGRGIWVSNGCRAEFELGDYRRSRSSDRDSAAAAALAIGIIGAAVIASQKDKDRRDYDRDDYDHYGSRADDYVQCESQDQRTTDCPIYVGRGRVEIERQLSSAPCRFGASWGYDRRAIWVSDGCRAEFAVYR
ncbi:MAG TPA: DUF3011 domain-containing protein [Tahibacter sp.]|nr:DUF3011 domain-containing protein [Tahibacter sp.]